jgi:type I restriction enzyme S subunit
MPAEFGVLKTSCVYTGSFRPSENKAITKDELDRAKEPVVSGTIIVSRMNTPGLVGASGYVEQGDPMLFLPDRLWQLYPKNDIDARWLAALIGSPHYRALLGSMATGTSSSMRNISQEGLGSLPVVVPPLHEQRCIAKILRTWDEAIEKAERLIAAKVATFDHWSHAVLTGRQRLRRERTNWQSLALTDVTREATARNAGSQLNANAVMGVNKLHGMIPMKDHVRAADLSRYKIVHPGAFAYNPMRLNIGSLAQNDHGLDVLVSPDYVVFEAGLESLLPAYFDHLRRTPMWSRFVKAAGSGGVRVRIYYDDLTDFILELPPLDEQARIVEVLDTGRREIAILERQRDALAKQKRGLMKKLLTGEWTVKVPESQEAAE